MYTENTQESDLIIFSVHIYKHFGDTKTSKYSLEQPYVYPRFCNHRLKFQFDSENTCTVTAEKNATGEKQRGHPAARPGRRDCAPACHLNQDVARSHATAPGSDPEPTPTKGPRHVPARTRVCVPAGSRGQGR